jgi:hypothetical protein
VQLKAATTISRLLRTTVCCRSRCLPVSESDRVFHLSRRFPQKALKHRVGLHRSCCRSPEWRLRWNV